MKINKLLIGVAAVIALGIASCKKSSTDVTNTGGTTPTNPTNPTNPTTPTVLPYSIKEDFESGTIKGAYADGNATLSTGIWDMNDALVGTLATDVKNGARSVRLKNGSIGMNFDIAGVTKVKISHSKYGADASTTWVLQMSVDGGINYTQLGNTITETTTTFVTDSFTVTGSPAKVRFKVLRTGATASSTLRSNIDDFTFIGTGDPGITVDGGDDSSTDGGGTTGGTAATARTVTVGADAPPLSGDNSNLLFGNPSGATTSSTGTPNNYLIDQGYYVESYNASRGEPNWVSWHLDATNTTGAASRQDSFAAWAGLPTGFFAVQSNSYSGSGFDRGHNCPSADRTSSTDANNATFLMTNMIPQAPQNNQQTWANLENYLRTQVVAGNEVYIIMGSYGNGGVGSNNATVVNNLGTGTSTIAVPQYVYKIAVIIPVGNGDIGRVATTTRVIAVNTPNINSINSDWHQYRVTVRSIEQATGYNFLSALPQSVQDAVETTVDTVN